MKINKKKLMKSFGIFVVLISITLIYFYSYTSKANNSLVIISFIINGLVIIFNILIDQKEFSLNKTFWYFNFFFFFVAPLFQYLTNYKMWGYVISDNLYLKTNFFIMICYLTYTLTKVLFLKVKIRNNEINSFDNKDKMFYSKKILSALFILTCISFIIIIINVSFKGLFYRDLNSFNIEEGTIRHIFENLLRAIPVYSVTYSVFYYRKKKKGLIFIVLELIMLILTNFPTSITRYWVGIVYIGLLLIFFTNKMNNRKFDICMIVIFAIIFPIFQLFKWYSISDLFNGGIDISKRLLEVYNDVDFDAYSIFSRSINLVENSGVLQMGHQILATIFFLVPRAIWPAKPYPTGQFIALSEKQFFTNISCPIYAEGYIDFGIFGSIIHIIIVCYFINKMDYLYWNKNNNDIKLIDFCYPFMFGALIFLLRGSMQPVIVYTFTFYLFFIIMNPICFKKEKISKKTSRI